MRASAVSPRRSERPPAARSERLGPESAVDYLSGDVCQPAAVVTGISPQQREGLGHVDPRPFADDAFGLFDDDATVQRITELVIESTEVEVCAVLKNGDTGDIRE